MIPGKMFEVMQPVRVMFGQGQITKLGEVATRASPSTSAS